MPLLIVIVVSILAFLSIMALLSIAAFSEYGQLRRIHSDPAAQPFTLALGDSSTTEHLLLWSTQIEALRLIASGGKNGVSYHQLYSVYRKSAAAFPEFYDGSSFAQWLFFLQRSKLITMSSFRVKVTEYGRSFLQYCMQTAVTA